MITAGNLRMAAHAYVRACAAANNFAIANAFEKAEAEKAADKAGERLEEAARQFVTQKAAAAQVDAS